MVRSSGIRLTVERATMLPSKNLLVKLLIAFIHAYLAMVDYGESSYAGFIDHYKDQLQNHHGRMALTKQSPDSIYHQVSSTTSFARVHHATDYGADPSGTSDSTQALQQAIFDAFGSPSLDLYNSDNDKTHFHLMQGIADLGGSQLHLDGGSYLISRPLRLPESGRGNFMIHGGSLRASNDFPPDRHLIELSSPSSSTPYGFEDVTLKELMIDSNFRGGGIAIINSLRTTVDSCYISHFTTNGILVKGGHETFISNTFIGQYINVGGDHREKDFSGIGINIMGNDNAITNVVIFSAAVGIMVAGQANVFSGVHCYNKATGLGGVGIYVKAPGFTQNRIVNSYFDFTGIVVEDPVQFHVTGSFFLGNAFILIKSVKGNMFGVNIVDNMFGGDYTGVPIVQLDEAAEPFRNVDQVVVDRNNARGMVLKSTVGKGTKWSNGTSWTVDLSGILLFPSLIRNVQYTLQTSSSTFPNHVLRNVSSNCITVESDRPVQATLHVLVHQS